ncbi:hypothetical protein [Bradyrhizobium sp. STM 3562]|uniref:hypothetical protein n=1 Tax=Bradyrhizobium sp. STM 3562 TaxID=578924 RepID=UPI003890E9AB
MSFDFPIAPPILIKDSPKPRRLQTLQEARQFAKDALALGRSPPWRDIHRRLAEANSEEDAVEAIGALRELLMDEGLLVSSDSSLD